MWTSPITLEALERSIKYYSLLASCPDGLGWAYVAVGVTAILSAGGQLSTVLKGGDSEVLFDGGSAGKSSTANGELRLTYSTSCWSHLCSAVERLSL
jgi:hypothetical protein